MFKDHLELKKHKNNFGVYSKIIIPQNKPIIEFSGTILKKENITNYSDFIQIGNNSYLGPSAEIDDKINHNCNPSCFLKISGSRVILFSLFEIKPNIELTYDYSLSCIDSDLDFDCGCGYFECRKKITTYNLLPENIKEKYNKLNIVPLYIRYNFFKK